MNEWDNAVRKNSILNKCVELEVERIHELITKSFRTVNCSYDGKGNAKCYKTICVRNHLFGKEVVFVCNFNCYKNRDVYITESRRDVLCCSYFYHRGLVNVSASVIGKKVQETAFTTDFAYKVLRENEDRDHLTTLPDSYIKLMEKADKTDVEHAVLDILCLTSRYEQDRMAETMYSELYAYDSFDRMDHTSCKSYERYLSFKKSLCSIKNKKDDDDLLNILGTLGYSYERFIALGEFAERRILRLLVQADAASKLDSCNHSEYYCINEPQYSLVNSKIEAKHKRDREDELAALRQFIQWNSDSADILLDTEELSKTTKKIMESDAHIIEEPNMDSFV